MSAAIILCVFLAPTLTVVGFGYAMNGYRARAWSLMVASLGVAVLPFIILIEAMK